MNIHRRSFLFGLGSLLVAPAIVRAASLMPVRVVRYENIFVCVAAGVSAPDASWMRAETIQNAIGMIAPGGTIYVDPAHVERLDGPLVFPKFGVFAAKRSPTSLVGFGGAPTLIAPRDGALVGDGGPAYMENMSFQAYDAGNHVIAPPPREWTQPVKPQASVYWSEALSLGLPSLRK